MPRLQDTRQYKAQEIKRMLELGPAFQEEFSTALNYRFFTTQTAAAQYQRWVRAWILPTILQLIPELKGAKIHGTP